MGEVKTSKYKMDVPGVLQRMIAEGYFKKANIHNNWLRCSCPLGHHTDNNPSFGINMASGGYNCFSCGETGHLYNLVNLLVFDNIGTYKEIQDYCGMQEISHLQGWEWYSYIKQLQNNEYNITKEDCLKVETAIFRSRLEEARLNENKKEENNKNKEVLPYITDEFYDKYRAYAHPYLKRRGITDELADIYDIGYAKDWVVTKNGKKAECVLFALKDKTGGIVNICARLIDPWKFKDGAIYKYVFMKDRLKPLYGVYELDKKRVNDPLIVCEGVIDALIARKYGYNAVALLGLGSKTATDTINELPHRKVYLCLDGDNAGLEAMKKISLYIKNKLISFMFLPKGRDIDELSKEEFDKVYNNAVRKINIEK